MSLFYQTVASDLVSALKKLMLLPSLQDFVLVGGTNLALQRGHRLSIDIDLFTDIDYHLINRKAIATEIAEAFPFCDGLYALNECSVGYHLFIGNSEDEILKLDLWTVDPFVFPIKNVDGIRMADIREICAFKLKAACQQDRRQKDFWDIYELLQLFSLNEMIELAEKRYPYSFDKKDFIRSLATVEAVELAPEGIHCLRGNYWELIVMDLMQKAQEYEI